LNTKPILTIFDTSKTYQTLPATIAMSIEHQHYWKKLKLDRETIVGLYSLFAVNLFASMIGALVFRNESLRWHLVTATLTTIALLFIAATFRAIDKILDQYFPFEANVYKRFFIQLFVCAIAVGIFRYLMFLLIGDAILKNFNVDTFPEELIGLAAMVNILICSVYILSIMGYRFVQRWKESSIRTLELEKEKAIVQFENLKNQLNPHFLFNSLSSLNSLIDENPPLASAFLQQLSKVYRYLLENNEKNAVSLQSELTFIQNYLNLLTTRFQKGLNITIQIEPHNKEKMLTPVTLQVLIENAIKHNITSARQPLNISITTQGDYLLVQNNLQRKNIISHSHQKGLNHLRTLYSHITQAPIEIIETPHTFTVKIPLLS
jgi:two-component system LytT family sensor kinase